MTTLSLAAACRQFNAELGAITSRLYAVAPELHDDRVRRDVGLLVRMFGDDMADESLAPITARRAYQTVWGAQTPPDEWWLTPLGQMIVSKIGYVEDEVPYLVAAAILDVSRQRVYQLWRDEQKLTKVEGQHAVTAASLREHFNASAVTV